MDDMNLSLLHDKFNMYHDNAQRAQKVGNTVLAKRNYMLAAEIMLKLAKESSPELKKARIQRAKRLMEIADNINCSVGNKAGNRELGNISQTAEQDNNGKQWVGSEIPDIHFTDIAGLNDVKKAITTRMINPIKYPDKYKLYNKKTGGGVLLYGPPGTGKTMIARAIACEVGATFYAVKGSDIVSKWVGESEKNISSLFETARKDKLAIIFIDEMDSLFGQRGVDTHNDKRVNEFLQQIDGFVGRNPNLLLLGATNRPWDIDSAAMRSGRFSQKIYVPLPDADARKFLFQKSLKNVPLDKDVDIDELVKLSENYSGADIDELCDRAKEEPLLRSIQSGELVPITRADLIMAFTTVKPSVSMADVARFESYLSNGNATAKVADRKPEPAKSDNNSVNEKENNQHASPDCVHNQEKVDNEKSSTINVQLDTEIIFMLPDNKPTVEFYINKDCDNVSVKIEDVYYACEKHIHNFITQPLDVKAGKYTLEILIDGVKIAEKQVEFVKGLTENDFNI